MNETILVNARRFKEMTRNELEKEAKHLVTLVTNLQDKCFREYWRGFEEGKSQALGDVKRLLQKRNG